VNPAQRTLQRVLEDGDDALKLFRGEITGALAKVDIGLLADQIGVAATNTLDLGQGVHDLLLAIDVGVEQTDDVLEAVDVSATFAKNVVAIIRPCRSAKRSLTIHFLLQSCEHAAGVVMCGVAAPPLSPSWHITIFLPGAFFNRLSMLSGSKKGMNASSVSA